MKIIDENGKLFSKINVIDFLVILFVVFLVPMFYFGYQVFTKKPIQVEGPRVIDTEINCRFIKIGPKILKLVVVGDKELDKESKQIGEITWIGNSKPYQYKIDMGSGKIESIEDPVLKELPAKIKLKAEIRGNNLYYKDKPLLINSPIDFKTDKYTIEATPTTEEKIEIKIDLDLYVMLKGLNDDTFKLISVGDKELDDKKEVIAEILSVGKIEKDTHEIDLSSGNFVMGEDSSKKQASIKIRLKVEMGKDKQAYFKGERITSNSLVEFKTDKYTLKGIIAKTYEVMPLPLTEKWLQVQVKFLGVIPELAKIIDKGDIEKDPSGKIVGRLEQIISNRSSDVLILKDDRFITVSHPFQKDIITFLNILSIEKEGILYFKNYPVKIGNMITFTTDLYSISGTIVGVKSD